MRPETYVDGVLYRRAALCVRRGRVYLLTRLTYNVCVGVGV